MFMGLFCGYFAGRLFKTLATPKSDWKSAALQSALLYPGVIFGLSFFLNFFIWGKKSSGAVPFTTMICILLLWFGISGIGLKITKRIFSPKLILDCGLTVIKTRWKVPLVFLGYYHGQKKPAYENPVRTNQIHRQIPEQQWFMNSMTSMLMAGILPFGAVFIELFFIFTGNISKPASDWSKRNDFGNFTRSSWDESSILISFRNVNKAIWENEFYYLFGFLFLVFIILIVACSQISIVMTYFQVYLEKSWSKVKTWGILASFLSDHTIKWYFSYVRKIILGGGDVSLSLVVVHSMYSLIRFSISLQN